MSNNIFNRLMYKLQNKTITKSLHVIYHKEAELPFPIVVDHWCAKYRTSMFYFGLNELVEETDEKLNKLTVEECRNLHSHLQLIFHGIKFDKKDKDAPKKKLTLLKIEKLLSSIETEDNYHDACYDEAGDTKENYWPTFYAKVKLGLD